MHSEDTPLMQKEPALQRSQDEEPLEPENFPEGQLVQIEAPFEPW